MNLLDDIRANKRNLKCILFLCSFRISRVIRMNRLLLLLFFFIPVMHVFFFNWILGFDIPLKTVLGYGVIIYHGQGLVINADAVIEERCILRHNTTIGNKIGRNGIDFGSPVIRRNCDIGAHVVIIGPVTIGENTSIGAGSVVTKDIPADSLAYGSPLRIKSRS